MKTKPDRWEKIREKGRVRFLWLYGVLLWGLPMGIIMSVIMDLFEQYMKNKFTFPASLLTKQFLQGLFIYTIIFLGAGYCYAIYLWSYFEKKWNNRKE